MYYFVISLWLMIIKNLIIIYHSKKLYYAYLQYYGLPNMSLLGVIQYCVVYIIVPKNIIWYRIINETKDILFRCDKRYCNTVYCIWAYTRLANIVIPIFLLQAVCNLIYGISLDGIFFYLNMLGFEVFAFLAFFILIYKNRDFFSSENIIARSITFIGRKTLEIYLLHYFFICQDLTPLGRFFIEHPSPLLELLCSGIITLVIVSICLFLGELIRKSSLCSKWLING